MNYTPEITIVVPVYQAFSTLRACVDSVLAQTYKQWELLLIDDGSDDGSLDLCYSLSEQDKRIQVYTQRHQGVSAARNLGLEKLKGEYICFVDADDTIEPDFLTELYQFREYDMVICGYYVDRYSEEGVLQVQEEHHPCQVIWDGKQDKQCLVPLFMQGMIHINCNKLLKTNVIRKYQIRYNNYPINEDYIFMLNYLFFAHSLVSVDRLLYHWRRFKNSISGLCCVPDDILEIYNESHVLTRKFFGNIVIGDTIMYDSYHQILFKYFNCIIKAEKSKEECWKELDIYYKNSLVSSTLQLHQCSSIGEKMLFFLHKNHYYKIYFGIYKHFIASL